VISLTWVILLLISRSNNLIMRIQPIVNASLLYSIIIKRYYQSDQQNKYEPTQNIQNLS
jgi:hypothetical protein